ncbi:hypothetical protein TCAL_12385 [Tigriopus californicus]|uniref:TNF receptor-associated factor 4 n=1 Tax=Tigriopus californicus TaxID=6832 RepID=A0A553PPM7_TIGCA|nr:TNF receptor-associated factor 4-like isoform X1 [Tigriopus californicus]TRY79633.1 hypothetical protein TCAL_12385 [Tigriopus californicus]|eukprot:TCALIF_12385-PA protein Name:"Similar to Traf4 TNF receptor-associated factor 4 (Mus musculus)" AED:0.01 eAED:0.01 QI:84/1/1/1/1/1/2/169/489
MMSPSYSLPWSCANQEDSAFHEPEYSNEYSNPESYHSYNHGSESCQSSPCPDYEEVDPQFLKKTKGLVYNLASEGIFQCQKNKDGTGINLDNDPITKEKIMQSMIYCIHKDEGCKWSGQLSKLKGHLNTCQKDAVACLNQCGAKIARMMMEDHMLYTCTKRLVPCQYCRKDFTGATIDDHQTQCGFEPVHCENKCGQKIQRNRLKAHQVNTCSKRLVTCQYCTRSFTADTLQSHHKKCHLFPVPCPNRCHVGTLSREDIEPHLAQECEAIVLQACQFREAGCNFRGSRSTLDQHYHESTQVHLDLMCSLVHKQQAHISQLTTQLERAHTNYNGVLLWKIKDLRAKLDEAKSSEGLELVSMPFYTSQCGYKLQASLFLNGNGGGEASHMSVYIKILPGEFDSILKWPFKHTVSFSLLDQNEDRKQACNIVESFIPDPSWPNFQRPSRQPDQLGFGFPKFVPHDMMESRDYIKDDSLYIKIRVDPSRNVAV